MPQGWTEKISTGSFAEARYTGSDFRTIHTIGTTCNGSCEPDK